MSVEALIAMEMKRKDAFQRASGTILEREVASLIGIVPPELPPLRDDSSLLPASFFCSPVAAEVYEAIFATAAATWLPVHQKLRLTPAGIEEARAYVSDLMDVSLESVNVEIIPMAEWTKIGAEGTHYRAGVDQHFIVMPEYVESPIEVLVHEFGHAAHTIRQRQNGLYPYFFAASSTVEFIAHFCQYRYILDRLTPAHLLVALGQLATASYALSIYSSGEVNDFLQYLRTDHAVELLRGVPIEILRLQYAQFEQNKAELLSQVNRGISLILALLLIDDVDGMRCYPSLDRIDVQLQEKLEAAFPRSMGTLSFSDINYQIQVLLSRFL